MKPMKTLASGLRKKPKVKALTDRRKKLISAFLRNVIETPDLYGKIGTKEWALKLISCLDERVKRQKTNISDIRDWFNKSKYFKSLLNKIPEWKNPSWLRSNLTEGTEDESDNEASTDETSNRDDEDQYTALSESEDPVIARMPAAPSPIVRLEQPSVNVLQQNQGLNELRNPIANEAGAFEGIPNAPQPQARLSINMAMPLLNPANPNIQLPPLPRVDQMLQNYTSAMMRMVQDIRELGYQGANNTINWEICFHALNILNLTSDARN